MADGDHVTTDEDELLVGAPAYVSKISLWRTILAVAGVTATGWLFLSSFPGAGWIGVGVATATLLVLSVSSNSVTERLARSYATELLLRSGLEETEENVARAKLVFNTRKTSNWLQFTSFLIAFLGLSISALVGLTDFRGSGFYSFQAFISLAWQLVFSFICIFGNLFASASLVLTDRSEDISFSPQTTGQTATLALPVEDRNDIDIAGLGVALQAVMRRAEAYTIESTLLSGLSFSAFIGIAFSDNGPLENASWVTQTISNMKCEEQLTLGVAYCLYDMTPFVSGHIKFIVAGLMLICAMLFMSAIIIRFRFNEAFRHTEEILAITRVLNEKETSAPPTSKPAITQAITTYLEKAKAGFRDMSPLSSAMRMFRNLGVISFTMAVATCGIYLHHSLFFILISIIILAYFFTHVDNIRRKTTFLPQLESAVMSVFHKKI